MENFFKNKKVLITGFNGFKGSWMSLMLSYLGAEVYGYSLNTRTNKKNEKIFGLKNILKQICYGDINNSVKLKNFFLKTKPHFCIHMAAQALVKESYANPAHTFQTNFNGTLYLLEILKKINIESIIVTSDKCYENNSKKFLKESDPLGGDDPYSASKGCVEILCNSYIKSYNLRISTVRAGNVLGGGDWSKNRLMPDIVKSLFQKKLLKIRNQNQIRPWQHVLDVNYAYLRLLKLLSQSSKYSDCYNISPIKSYKVKQVLTYLRKKYDLTYKKTKCNFVEKKAIFLSRKKIEKLGIKNFFSFQDSIKATILWYQEYYNNNKNIIDFTKNQIKDYFYFNKI
jgi:CDP-glucose 4,6-dehydratase